VTGHLALILHAHLPFVRHPEHEKALEESWLFEAITESYLPLLQMLESWRRDGVEAPFTLTLSPTLCAMLLDPLLRGRFATYLEGLIGLAEKEIVRNYWEQPLRTLAEMYLKRFTVLRESYLAYDGNLVAAFGGFQASGQLEIIPCAATHAVLPLLAQHPPSIRAQVLIACDFYRHCFGVNPQGFWLPECAYCEGVEEFLVEAKLRWFILDTHGVMHARPQPRNGVLAPILTPNGLAAFGREPSSARQVWSRAEGYPGDENYRDFYRDIGFDLEFDYISPHFPCADHRGFTGIKYHAITGGRLEKAVYDREAALRKAAEHAAHFVGARVTQIRAAAATMDTPPLLVLPYDAELFGHWWYEGPEFLDQVGRTLVRQPAELSAITPSAYLRRHSTHQVCVPSPSSWGEEGYARVWLNEVSAWVYPQLQSAQQRMSGLARSVINPSQGVRRALQLAAQELLLAQASDWPFILRNGTSPRYAEKRLTTHLQHFNLIYDQLRTNRLDEGVLAELAAKDTVFPELEFRYWA
jgi:1,4-alpha-glucan branching enzyme